MKSFFKGVRRHIDRLDAEHLREQYGLLAGENAFLETILNSIKDGIIILDDNGSVIDENRAAAEILGMKTSDALPFLEIPVGKATKRELSVTYPEAKDLEIQTIPTEHGTVVVLRDTTAERIAAEKRIESGATNAVRDLAAGVAHEIGNPLNALSLNLQLMERHPECARELAGECRAQITRLDGIIRGFLAALRPTKPNLAPGSITEPLKNCISTLKTQFEERRISVTLDVSSALPAVAIDRAQMEQVFFNLVKNALEALKDGGSIAITLDSDDSEVIVKFKDDGVGMTAEQLTHLFEPYKTSKEHGTGLGLMITERIVRDHGGSIAAESKPGEGTTFTIRLPRLEKRVRELKG